MANLIEDPTYTWAEGDVYEIAATDQVQGAGSSGIGIANQQAQILVNKAQFLRKNQVIDEANIAALQLFVAKFVSLLAATGYIEIPVNDVNLGAQVAVIQWGTIDWGSSGEPEGLYGPYNFPLAFPNAVLAVLVSTITPETPSNDAWDDVVMVSTTNPPTPAQFYVWNNNLGAGGNRARGFTWIAIGY